MPAIRFQTVSFDLDGTLVDTAPDLTDGLNHALAHLGRPPVPDEEVRHMVGHGVRALLVKGLIASGGSDDALVDAGFPVFLDYYEAHIADRSRPFAGVEAALDALAADGVRLAVCTNKREGLARSLIEALGWTHRFAAIVGGDTMGVAKPDPTPLLASIERAGGGAAAYVGDSITDTTTAQAAGIPCVALSFGYSDRPAADLGADRLIDHWDDLIPALASL
jgi:phosphoglycolate phosphatase